MSRGRVTEDQVLAVLTGRAVPDGDLADATELFRAAGRAALAQQAAGTWLQVRLRFPDWNLAESSASLFLAPALDRLCDGGVLDGWWYLRKHPDWRLRCLPGRLGHDTATHHLVELLESLADAGTIGQWHTSHYEPELLAFGGPTAMDAAHHLFVADSREILQLASRVRPSPGRRELSIALCTAMLRAAALDPCERADVWDRVAASRPREAARSTAEQITGMTPSLHRLIHLDTRAGSTVFDSGEPLAFAGDWFVAFRTAGTALATADADGQLRRELREVLATIVRHHWNRTGLPDATQALLALAARHAEMTPARLPDTPDRP